MAQAECDRHDEERFEAEAEDLVRHMRRLGQADAAAHEVDLAEALVPLSIALTNADRQNEGLAVSQEAAEVWQRLAEADPAAHEPDFTQSLGNLAEDLSASAV